MTSLVRSDYVVVKCDPDIAIELRDKHEEICGAWHFNKRHWNSIRLNGDLCESFILEQIFNSYILVIKHNVTPVALRKEVLNVAEGISIAKLLSRKCKKVLQ